MRRRKIDTPEHLSEIRAGVRWVLKMKQPKDAIVSHHGISRYFGRGALRSIQVSPRGHDGTPVLIFARRQRPWKPERVCETCRRPFSNKAKDIFRWEVEDIDQILNMVGRVTAIRNSWNGAGTDSFSVSMMELAGEGVSRAVENYHKGCLEHPHEDGRGNVFCKCGWYGRGFDLLRVPKGWG